MNRAFPAIIVAVATFASSGGSADAMECGGRLIEVGDTEQQVLDMCGEPYRREVRNRGVPAEYGGLSWQSPETEEWTYQPGPGQFVRHLRFENGTLDQIRAGGYADLD